MTTTISSVPSRRWDAAERADRVLGHQAAGVADDVGVPALEAEHREQVDPRVHAGQDGDLAAGLGAEAGGGELVGAARPRTASISSAFLGMSSARWYGLGGAGDRAEHELGGVAVAEALLADERLPRGERRPAWPMAARVRSRARPRTGRPASSTSRTASTYPWKREKLTCTTGTTCSSRMRFASIRSLRP